MKEFLKDSAPVGKMLAGATITGVVKSINPPPADDITKQPITLIYPGDEGLELRCNIMGEHLHLTPDKAGKVITTGLACMNSMRMIFQILLRI